VEKYNKLWLGILIGVLASLVVGLVGYIVYDNASSKNDNEIVNNEDITDNDIDSSQEQQKEVTVDLSLDNSIVKDLASRVVGVYTNNMMSLYENYFYKKDRIVMSEEDMSFKLSLAAESFSSFFGYDKTNYDCNTGICGISFASEELIKDAYFDLFGKDARYERTSFSVATCQGRDGYVWSEENNRYESDVPDGCGGTSLDGTMSKLGYAKQITSSNLDRIELYEYFTYEIAHDEGDTLFFNYYSDYNRTNLITSTTNSYSNEEFFNEFVDEVGIYKYTFEKDKYGTYVFTSVEKLK